MTIEEIDARSNKLLDEFQEYYQGITAKNAHIDKEACYASWSVQKIAYLQLRVEELARNIGKR